MLRLEHRKGTWPWRSEEAGWDCRVTALLGAPRSGPTLWWVMETPGKASTGSRNCGNLRKHTVWNCIESYLSSQISTSRPLSESSPHTNCAIKLGLQ